MVGGNVIIVEGIIGAGKTTFSRLLSEHLDCQWLQEPDEKKGNPYLASFYKDPTRWALTMQLHLLNTRFRMHQHAQWSTMQNSQSVIIDRSYFGDTAFARLQLKNGTLTKEEYDTYVMSYHNMTSNVLLPQICIHLITTPEVSNKRISKRMEIQTGRKCESAIDLQYLRDLDTEETLMIDTLEKQGVKIFRMEWNDEKTEDEIRISIKKLCDEINSYTVPDLLMDLHRRTIK
jgi:deoxyadenosine/deoxycytidine kinase